MTIKIKSISFRFAMVSLITASLLSFYSCNHSGSSSTAADSTSTSPVARLTNKIDTLHEQVMNKIGPLRKLEDSIGGRIKTAADKGKDTTALSHLAKALNTSDTAMFGWMGQYDMHLDGKSDSEKIEYLQLQLQKLARLNRSMDSAMEVAGKQLK